MVVKTLNLEKIVAESDNLPILSKTAVGVIELTREKNISVDSLKRLIEKERGLASTLLRVVNSSYYSFSREIFTVEQAVISLGFESVKNIIIGRSILTPHIWDDYPIDLKRFSEDSFIHAIACRLLARHWEPHMEETAFVMGLLMNVGQTLFALHYPEEYKEIIEQTQSNDYEICRLERQVFLWDHTRLGAMLLRHWDFSDRIVIPIFFHHTQNPPDRFSGRDEILLPIAYIANLILHVFRFKDKKIALDLLLAEAKRRLDMSEDAIRDIMEHMVYETKNMAAAFHYKLTFEPNFTKILHEVNIQLGRLNLDYEQTNRELIRAKLEAEKLAHQLKMMNDELQRRVEMDGLTGIYNHRYFQEHLAIEFSRATRHDNPLSLILLDVDFFKRVNDTYGHLTGDEVLKEIAELLRKNTRISDIVARYGGEEFAIILPETVIDNAYIVAEKIRIMVENNPFQHADRIFKVTISAGVASIQKGRMYETTTDLINDADKKLYRAKQGGRNRVVK